jgi:hypothetical protein
MTTSNPLGGMPQTHTTKKTPIIGGHWMRPVRLWLLGAAVSVLAACSAVQLAYRQAPNLSYWWIDRQLNLDDAQEALLRQDVDAFFVWHRQQGLPELTSQLRRWQAQARNDWTAEQVCREVDWLRGRAWQALDQTLPAAARLSLQLQPVQLQRLARQQAESNQEFRKDFVDGSPQVRIDKRVERTSKRLQQFYGSLSTEQEALLRQWLARSPWDGQRALAERQRRQQDMRDTIRLVQTSHGSRPTGDASAAPAVVQTALREAAERALNPSAPDAKAYNEAFQRHSCAQLAAIHNSMSANQRQELARTLGRYADELTSVMRPD